MTRPKLPLVGLPADTYSVDGLVFHSVGDKYVRATAEVGRCATVVLHALGAGQLDAVLDHLSGVVLTYTDRANELTGTFQTSDRQPASDYYVVAIPEDRSLWRTGSRRLVSTRPATDGRFSFTRIPAGDYRLAGLIDFDPGDFADRTFLDTLLLQGIPVTVRDGARTVQDIRVAQ